MAALKEYTFYNVTSHEEAMYNFANAIADAGWIIDKIQIVDSNNCDLYVHSNGINGNQNLYYSFRFYRQSSTLSRILLYANTGFDSNQPVNNQPGKWFEISNMSSSCTNWCALFVPLPISTQKVFANSWFAMLHTQHPANYSQDPFLYLPLFKIGTLELYKSDYSQCNLVHVHNRGTSSNFVAYDFQLVYLLFENQQKSASLPFPLFVFVSISAGNTWIGTPSIPSFVYSGALTAHPMTNKTILIKPVASVSHSIGGYNYFFPVGEMPIYHTLFYPYYYPYDLITFGGRKFRILPVFRKTYQYGIAIEIQQP